MRHPRHSPTRLAVAFACLLGAPLAHADGPPPRPAQLGLCASCHGEDGRARMPLTPHLAAQKADYLVVALRAYRDGGRDHAAMHAIAGALRDADIDALATWYAAQEPVR